MASSLFTRTPPLFLDLAKVIEGDIDCSLDTLTNYSHDTSPYSVMPQAIIYPKSSLDIKHILSFAREYTMPITIRGGGEAAMGGSLGEGIIIDMKRYLDKIRNVNMIENTVTADAGVLISSLIEKVHSWNFDIPPLAHTSDSEATLGGALATKNVNPYTWTHGTIREWIESLTVILDTGEEHELRDGITPSGRLLGIYQAIFPILTEDSPTIRASKPTNRDDATGYTIWNTSIGPRQLIDQLVGSEGTLGIITSVTLRTIPHKKHTHTLAIPLMEKKDMPFLLDVARAHHADGIYLYDKEYMELGRRYIPTEIPYFLEANYVLLVSHTHTDENKLRTIVSTFKQSLPFEDYLMKSFAGGDMISKISSPQLLHTLCNMYSNNTLSPIALADGLVVGIKQIPNFLDEIESYLGATGRPSVITGNIGSGHIAITTLFDHHRKNYAEELLNYASDIFSTVKKYNGGISAASGEGLAKTPFLNLIYNKQTLSIFKKIKNAWDPLHILNPGKKGDVSTDYLAQHTYGLKKDPARE